jgi:nucleotide-binding universal stress UspA family protein
LIAINARLPTPLFHRGTRFPVGQQEEAPMIKDLLLILTDDAKRPAALDYAASVAAAFDAHLAGAAIVNDLFIPGTVFDAPAAALMAEFHQQSKAAAERAVAQFEEKCRRDSVKAESFTLDAQMSGPGEVLSNVARGYDLTILPQSAPNAERDGSLLAEAVLFGSGRPVLFVPYIQTKPFKAGRVVVAWDGSAVAARAVADAMPFLMRATTVDIVTVTPDAKAPAGPGAGIARHLARHGLGNVDVRTIVADNVTVTERLLADAANRETDLLVMGGYGHSRLRQFVLGGVTREILASTSVPTLLSH